MSKIILAIILIILNICSSRFLSETIKLPAPQTEGGMPLYETMNNRHSNRDFTKGAELSLEELSQLLWVGYGIKKDGHRSAASSHGIYPFDMYVFMSSGVYKYKPETHELELIFNKDFRELTGNDEYVPNASINIALVGVLEREAYIKDEEIRRWSCDLDAGHTLQNMLLYAANAELKCVPRLNFAQTKILSILGLDDKNYYIPLCISIGK